MVRPATNDIAATIVIKSNVNSLENVLVLRMALMRSIQQNTDIVNTEKYYVTRVVL